MLFIFCFFILIFIIIIISSNTINVVQGEDVFETRSFSITDSPFGMDMLYDYQVSRSDVAKTCYSTIDHQSDYSDSGLGSLWEKIDRFRCCRSRAQIIPNFETPDLLPIQGVCGRPVFPERKLPKEEVNGPFLACLSSFRFGWAFRTLGSNVVDVTFELAFTDQCASPQFMKHTWSHLPLTTGAPDQWIIPQNRYRELFGWMIGRRYRNAKRRPDNEPGIGFGPWNLYRRLQNEPWTGDFFTNNPTYSAEAWNAVSTFNNQVTQYSWSTTDRIANEREVCRDIAWATTVFFNTDDFLRWDSTLPIVGADNTNGFYTPPCSHYSMFEAGSQEEGTAVCLGLVKSSANPWVTHSFDVEAAECLTARKCMEGNSILCGCDNNRCIDMKEHRRHTINHIHVQGNPRWDSSGHTNPNGNGDGGGGGAYGCQLNVFYSTQPTQTHVMAPAFGPNYLGNGEMSETIEQYEMLPVEERSAHRRTYPLFLTLHSLHQNDRVPIIQSDGSKKLDIGLYHWQFPWIHPCLGCIPENTQDCLLRWLDRRSTMVFAPRSPGAVDPIRGCRRSSSNGGECPNANAFSAVFFENVPRQQAESNSRYACWRSCLLESNAYPDGANLENPMRTSASRECRQCRNRHGIYHLPAETVQESWYPKRFGWAYAPDPSGDNWNDASTRAKANINVDSTNLRSVMIRMARASMFEFPWPQTRICSCRSGFFGSLCHLKCVRSEADRPPSSSGIIPVECLHGTRCDIVNQIVQCECPYTSNIFPNISPGLIRETWDRVEGPNFEGPGKQLFETREWPVHLLRPGATSYTSPRTGSTSSTNQCLDSSIPCIQLPYYRPRPVTCDFACPVYADVGRTAANNFDFPSLSPSFLNHAFLPIDQQHYIESPNMLGTHSDTRRWTTYDRLIPTTPPGRRGPGAWVTDRTKGLYTTADVRDTACACSKFTVSILQEDAVTVARTEVISAFGPNCERDPRENDFCGPNLCGPHGKCTFTPTDPNRPMEWGPVTKYGSTEPESLDASSSISSGQFPTPGSRAPKCVCNPGYGGEYCDQTCRAINGAPAPHCNGRARGTFPPGTTTQCCTTANSGSVIPCVSSPGHTPVGQVISDDDILGKRGFSCLCKKEDNEELGYVGPACEIPIKSDLLTYRQYGLSCTLDQYDVPDVKWKKKPESLITDMTYSYKIQLYLYQCSFPNSFEHGEYQQIISSFLSSSSFGAIDWPMKSGFVGTFTTSNSNRKLQSDPIRLFQPVFNSDAASAIEIIPNVVRIFLGSLLDDMSPLLHCPFPLLPNSDDLYQSNLPPCVPPPPCTNNNPVSLLCFRNLVFYDTILSCIRVSSLYLSISDSNLRTFCAVPWKQYEKGASIAFWSTTFLQDTTTLFDLIQGLV